MVPNFYENILLRLRRSQDGCKETILAGSYKTLEEYKSRVGELKGLLDAEYIVKKTYKDMYEISKEEIERE